MGKRRLARVLTIQFLYQIETVKGVANEDDFEGDLKAFWELRDNGVDFEVKEFMKILAKGVCENVKGIDEIINKYSSHWKIHRMANIDRNILRMALYEMLYMDEIPHAVTINEAVEIAKKYGSEESSSFVNGILDRIRIAKEQGELKL